MLASFIGLAAIAFLITQSQAIALLFGVQRISILEFLFIILVSSSVLLFEEVRKRLKIFID